MSLVNPYGCVDLGELKERQSISPWTRRRPATWCVATVRSISRRWPEP
jgi:hypothetical protein